MDQSITKPLDARRVAIKILGIPRASFDAAEVILPEKAYCLIALLAVAPGGELPLPRICDFLWPDGTDTAARASLRQLCKRLKDRLGGIDIVPATATGRRLSTEGLALDLRSFLKATEPPADIEQVIDLYGGELLLGIDDQLRPASGEAPKGLEDWLAETRAYFREHCLAAVVPALDGRPARSGDALRIAEFVLRIDPCNEAAWRAIIGRYVAAGDAASALRAFERCRRAYKRGLGIEPDEALAELVHNAASVPKSGDAPPLQVSSDPLFSADFRGGAPRLAVIKRLPRVGSEHFERYDAKLTSLVECLATTLAADRTMIVITIDADSTPPEAAAAQVEADYALVVSVAEDARGRLLYRLLTWPVGSVAAGPVMTLWSLSVAFGDATVDLDLVAQDVLSEVETAEGDRGRTYGRSAAHGYYLQGRTEVHRTDLPSIRRARNCFCAALKLDPRYVPALSGLSRSYLMEWFLRGDPANPQIRRALELAQDAVRFDPRDFRGFHRLAHANLYLHNFDDSLEQFSKALRANSTDADLLADYADAQCHAVGIEEALQTIRLTTSIRGIQRENRLWILGSIYYFGGRWQEAIETYDKFRDSNIGLSSRAGGWAMLGELDLARHFARKVTERNPYFRVDWSVAMAPNRDRLQCERHEASLRLAGLA